MSLVYWITTEQGQRLAIVERPRGDGWLEDDIRSLYEAGIEVVVSALTPAVPRFDDAFTSVLLEIRERM